MKYIQLGKSGLNVPVVAVGCMRIGGLALQDANRLIMTAIERSANFFDHADIYGGGGSESTFADALGMNSSVREKIILQSKCGIRKGMFDFSRGHILESVDGSLKRLKTDYLDVLLLHRPDALMDPDEVAGAFDVLKSAGKVRHFGVSNQNPGQMALLQKSMDMPIVANQLQLSITNATMISGGINVNMLNESAVSRDDGVLNYCRLNDITIQPWSPLQYGFFEGPFIGSDKHVEINKTLNVIAEKYGVTATTIAIAWLLRHPAHMQPITGTRSPERLIECLNAVDVTLTREEWYEIYRAAGNILP